MNTNKIFYGNLMYDNELMGRFIFLKIGREYIFLNDINNIIDILKIKQDKIFMPKFTTNNDGDNYYIDKESLTPYYEKKGFKTLRKIKLDYLSDTMNSRIINH